MRKTLSLLAAVALAFPLAPASAGYATLDDPADTVAWPGRAYTTTDAPVPDTFDLYLELPDDYWATHDGGVEVAVRWTSEYNLFDLYVLNVEDQVLASATGFPTSAQSLIIPKPPNGRYQVVVVPQIQVNDAYSGIAQIELKPDSIDALVPDLVPLPPDNFKIATGAYSFLAVENEDGGCYPDEQVELAVERCLRFDSAVANFGDGPFELWLDTATMASDAQPVYQDLFERNGTPLGDPIPVGSYTFHATHGHMHYQNFATYSLYTWVSDALGEMVGTSRKADFCMIDTRLLWFGEPRGNGPRNHHFPNCNVPGTERNSGPTIMRQGIDVGWADVYTWDLPGQFIDISDVEPGEYAVVIDVNPAGVLEEVSKDNNRAFAVFTIPPP